MLYRFNIIKYVVELTMKKIYLLVLGVLAAAVVGAENVSSVSFNPARLGNYEHLKVSGRASFPGGLQSDDLNLGSSLTGNFSPDESEIRLVSPDTTPISANSVFGNKGENSFISMPSAFFMKGSSYTPCNFATGVCNFPSRSEPISTANWFGTKVYMSSGTMEFGKDSTGPASFIKDLYANELLLQRADVLKVDGALEVTGNVEEVDPDGIVLVSSNPVGIGKPVSLLQSNGSRNATTLLKLAGVNIPYPDINSVRYNPGGGDATKPKAYKTSFQPFTNSSMDDCQLRWVKRKITPQPGETDQYVHVLALAGDCKLSCTPTGKVSGYVYDECPPGTTGKKKRLRITETTCENGEPETKETYVGDWDTSGCSSQPKWVWQRSWRNTYESGYMGTQDGWQGLFKYHPGVVDTPCGQGNPYLHVASTIIGVNWWDFVYFGENCSDDDPGGWDFFFNAFMDSHTSVVLHRLFKNYMGGNRSDVADAHSHLTRNDDRKQPAPTCSATSGYLGKTIEEKVYLIRPMVAFWPVKCKGWGLVNEYKCE